LPRIFELDPHVADLIAAGEVVERPASVVKELMENSIDAGAGIITVEITAGGLTYIRVTDNGCGIAPEDVTTAFLRHATSKLRAAEGLEAIETLGFRGEALAAIAAVSRISLLTRETGAKEGVSLSLVAGAVADISPAGCPEGTTIIVRDLFFNTPARLKFVKSDRAESSGVASAVLRCALSHPEVSVRFIRDGKTEYHTPGDSRVDSCIYSLFGREFAAGLISAESSDEAVSVVGFVSAPAAARGNRSYQFFFVNGRPIRSVTLQAALERAYANKLPGGRFPACVLYITTKPGNVDVNVHPAKTEVKFVSDKQVFDGVYYATLGALEQGFGRSAALGESGAWGVDGARGVGGALSIERGSVGDGSSVVLDTADKAPKSVVSPGFGFTYQDSKPSATTGRISASGGFKSMQVDEYNKKYASGDNKHRDHSGNAQFYTGAALQSSLSALGEDPSLSALGEGASLSALASTAPFRVIGEALNTYIVVEYRNSVWFIDKHAAHERIHFNALRDLDFEPMSQALITPVICRHGHEEVSLLLQSQGLLGKLGFSVESFGEDAVAVRRIPAEIDIGDVEPVLSQISAELKLGGISEPARRDNILRSVACKAAIKAGRSSGIRELETLAARVISGEISQCPHGRPVAFELSKTTLDKSFKRI